MISRGLYLSLTSGALASSASLLGKLAMSPTICCQFINSCHPLDIKSFFVISIQVLIFVLMIITNALMWTQFTKALKAYSNSLHVLVVNTSANFFLTAFYGKVFFGESLSTLWWFGSTLILFGLLIMKSSNSDENYNKNK